MLSSLLPLVAVDVKRPSPPPPWCSVELGCGLWNVDLRYQRAQVVVLCISNLFSIGEEKGEEEETGRNMELDQ